MTDSGSLVESLPDRPLKSEEKAALERTDPIQLILAQEMKPGPDGGNVLDTALFVGHDWVAAVTYEDGRGWTVIYRSEMTDDILADGLFRSSDLYEGHPIQEGMNAMEAAQASDGPDDT